MYYDIWFKPNCTSSYTAGTNRYFYNSYVQSTSFSNVVKNTEEIEDITEDEFENILGLNNNT